MPLIVERPLSVVMWDVSWLERRQPGGGFEDWDVALREVVERGYDCVKIDPYLHLIADGADTHTVGGAYPQFLWGSPESINIHVRRDLAAFVAKCHEYGVKLVLEGLFSGDARELNMRIATPEDQAQTWIKTLDFLGECGVADDIVYVDLCNEFPVPAFSPFYSRGRDVDSGDWRTDEALDWMRRCTETVRAVHPEHSYCFSFCGTYGGGDEVDLSFFDLLSLNLWLQSSSVFGELLADPLADARSVYYGGRDRWYAAMDQNLAEMVAMAERNNLPLVTSEGWAIVHQQDGPGVTWDWVQDISAYGVRRALETRRWAMLTPSNMASPQWTGLWQDVAWHKEMTDVIRRGRLG